VTNCLTTIDSGLDRRRRSQSGVNFNCPNFLVGQGRCWGALEEKCDGVLAWPMRQLKARPGGDRCQGLLLELSLTHEKTGHFNLLRTGLLLEQCCGFPGRFSKNRTGHGG
jgi:hypothetical protein